jgi:hypothetical protein
MSGRTEGGVPGHTAQLDVEEPFYFSIGALIRQRHPPEALTSAMRPTDADEISDVEARMVLHPWQVKC